MHAFGIRGEVLGVITSNLTNRHQFVRFDRVKSDLLAVKSGVPQGSILGPLFFIIFINDLSSEFDHSIPYLSADDLKLLHTNLLEMQEDLFKFELWVAKNGMDLQLKKCYLLNFKPQTDSIMLYGKPLKCPSIVRDLGIWITNNLSFHDHLTIKLKKANSVFWMIRRNIPNNLDWKSRLCLYKSMILPIITFGSMCWVLSRSDCRLIEAFQKRVTKWIFSYGVADYFTRMSAANLLPVPMFLQLLDLLHLSSICSGAYDYDYTSFINYCDIGKQRCHSDLFILKSLNYVKSRDSFFFRTQRVANNLPIDVNFTNPVGLKNRLLSLMHQKLKEKFDENNVCTWRLCCDCPDCRPLRCL